MKKYFIFVFLVLATSIFATTIYDVQYTTVAGPDGTYPSPMDGQDVTVTGIVTGANYDHGENMFFMSDPEGGAWHGIYVYDFDTGPALGDEVEVTGTVAEYYGLTELSYCTTTILSSGNTVPAPSVVSTLNLVVPAQAELYEGCLVEVANVEVTEAQGEYGQWFIDDGTGECMVDDGFFYLDSVTPPIEITVGMTWYMIRGCLIYSFDEYSINPRTPDDLMETLPMVCDFSADPMTGPVALEVTFTDLSTGGITTWEWDFDNDGTIDSNEQNPTYLYDEVGVYTVVLSIGNGTTTETETKVDYITVDPSLICDFTADPLAGLVPLEIQFTDATIGTPTSWEWDFDNDGNVDSTDENPIYTYDAVGDYTVSLTVSDAYYSTTETKIDFISVGDEIIADFSGNPLYGLAPLEVQFIDSSVGGITVWEWDFDNDGTIDSNEQDPSYTYTAAGLYTVVLTVGDGTNFDTETKADYVEVTEVGAGGEILPTFTSLAQNYPNPFNPSTTIYFSVQEGRTAELQIFNTKGQKLVAQEFYSGSHNFEWNASNQSSGIYFYKLISDDFAETRKMILLK
jgi:PKD repeat protein